MDREWLARRLDEGASYEALAREAGCHPSTVAYWADRYGLSSCHGVTHKARGGIAREELARLIDAGLSVRQIAHETGFGPSTVRYWIRRHGLKSQMALRREEGAVAADAGADEAVLTCPTHGPTRHVRRDRGLRCTRCRADAVSDRRRRVKALLLAEAGGKCVVCGYDRCARALEFHHLNPGQKRFGLGQWGLSLAIEKLREEAAKCVLLCSNCHAEVEDGMVDIPERPAQAATSMLQSSVDGPG